MRASGRDHLAPPLVIEPRERRDPGVTEREPLEDVLQPVEDLAVAPDTGAPQLGLDL